MGTGGSGFLLLGPASPLLHLCFGFFHWHNLRHALVCSENSAPWVGTPCGPGCAAALRPGGSWRWSRSPGCWWRSAAPLHCLGPPPQGRWWVGVLILGKRNSESGEFSKWKESGKNLHVSGSEAARLKGINKERQERQFWGFREPSWCRVLCWGCT